MFSCKPCGVLLLLMSMETSSGRYLHMEETDVGNTSSTSIFDYKEAFTLRSFESFLAVWLETSTHQIFLFMLSLPSTTSCISVSAIPGVKSLNASTGEHNGVFCNGVLDFAIRQCSTIIWEFSIYLLQIYIDVYLKLDFQYQRQYALKNVCLFLQTCCRDQLWSYLSIEKKH